MKKHKLIVIGTFAAMMMMAMTACSTKTTETTAAVTTVAETTTAEATTKESETETETTVETEAAKAGKLDDTGKFVAANGTFELTLPKGWIVDGESDENVAIFSTEDGSSYLEVQYEAGDIDGLAEELPDSKEEYKSWVIRSDEAAEFTHYNVENTENGQNYQYAIKYTGEEADPNYMSINVSYDLKAGTYLNATAVVQSESEDAVKVVDELMNSFKIIK